MFGGRPLGRVLAAGFAPRHWRAAANMLKLYRHPLDAFRRYLTATGEYPCTIEVKTPLGWIAISVYSPHDVLTINEIFCRQDYKADASDRVIVDFGSNIGISALYFLTRSRESYVYCYEPLPQNCERFRANVARLAARCQLDPRAVALQEGTVEFGYEPSGRYGGIGLPHGATMQVDCCHAINVLERVLREHGRIDVLKIDIESLEQEILLAIPQDCLRSINKIYIEASFDDNPLAATHRARTYGAVTQFNSVAAPLTFSSECAGQPLNDAATVHID